jgi:hypothetical protein
MRTGLCKAPWGRQTYTDRLIMQTLNPGDSATVPRIVSEYTRPARVPASRRLFPELVSR